MTQYQKDLVYKSDLDFLVLPDTKLEEGPELNKAIKMAVFKLIPQDVFVKEISKFI
eukprot:UN05790